MILKLLNYFLFSIIIVLRKPLSHVKTCVHMCVCVYVHTYSLLSSKHWIAIQYSSQGIKFLCLIFVLHILCLFSINVYLINLFYHLTHLSWYQVLEMSPIEVAIDEMESRVKELLEIINKHPTDVKKLQLKLQVRYMRWLE